MNKWTIGAVALGAGLVSGCAGPMFEGTIFEQPAPGGSSARSSSGVQPVSSDIRQLSDQIEALNRSFEVMDGRLNRLETQQAAGAGAHSADDLAGLRRDIQLLRADRETLRKEITEDLAGRVEKIAARQQAEHQAAKSPAAPARTAGAASGSAASAPARSGYEHVVEKGQTLSEIARGYGKSLDAIMKANKISNPSSIRVGQKLFIPD